MLRRTHTFVVDVFCVGWPWVGITRSHSVTRQWLFYTEPKIISKINNMYLSIFNIRIFIEITEILLF